MSEIKKNIELNNGWILCPSKRFPGKFYYFNVLNGENAWSLSQTEFQNNDSKKEHSFHKITDKAHGYPEPTTPPEEPKPMCQNIFTNIQRQQISNTPQLPTFGQAIFPKYVTNVEHLNPNIVWTAVPFPMFWPEIKPKEFEREWFAKSTNIPLCKRFKNYEPPCISFDTKNKTANIVLKYETSTPKTSLLECVSEPQNFIPKSLIKEPKIFESVKKPIINACSKVDSTKPSTDVQKDRVLDNLDSTDLRFHLLAKRKSLDTPDAVIESKKTKPIESKPLILKKKVTFNLNNKTDDDTNQEDFIPLTLNQTRTIDSQALPKDKTTTFIVQEKSKTPLPEANQPPAFLPTAIKQPHTANNQQPSYQNTTWYIVVDTDVLLLDYEFIENIVFSDPKCRLVIPFAVAANIEALCLGDCRGQQRVISARQLTRKLAAPPPQFIVEPQTSENGSLEVTTDSILACCMKIVHKNYYVVLITNDPHLQMRATLQNIPSYKVNEIKYGVDINPCFTPEPKNTSNNDIATKNLFNQNLSLLSNLRIKPVASSEEKTNISKTRNEAQDENKYNQTFGLFNFRTPVQKQLFLSSDSETDNSDSYKLINVTKPKCMKNIESMTRPDSDGTSDISSEVSNLKLKDKYVLKPQNSGRNPFLRQSVKENGFGDFKQQIRNSDTVFRTYSFEKTIPNEKVLETNHETNEFQKDFLEYNFENRDKLFCSIPITNMKLLDPKPKPLKSQEEFGLPIDNKTLNPTQARVQKIMNTTKTNPKNQIESSETKDRTGIFKIPRLLPIKNATRNTSVQAESPTMNDTIGTRINIDPIDENLMRFCIKSKNMRTKIKTRIDEWVCCYMQIMEEALVNILEKNSICMKNTAAPLTLKDTLNCIKMLYDSHTKIIDVTNKLSELLDKCMVCVQGKMKLSVAPEDYMKMFGYGAILVITLKTILPTNEELKEAEVRLNALQTSLESTAKDFDPELVKTPSASCAGVDLEQDEVRPAFLKKRSYVVDYLKKHYEKWATYEEDLNDDQISHMIENHRDFKVVRTCGKNLNMLKLDRTKTMSISKNTTEDNSANRTKDGLKILRLFVNNQINKTHKVEAIKTTNNETSAKSKVKSLNNENEQNDIFSEFNEILTDKENDGPLKKFIENKEQEKNIESIAKEDLNHTTHKNENILQEENAKEVGPKIVRNIELVDKFAEKTYRQPLDLDLLDYSEIYEPSLNENVDFEIISDKNKKSEEITNFDENNFGLTNTVCNIDDFFITPSVSAESILINYFNNTKETINNNNTENITSNNNLNSESEKNNKNAQPEEKTEKINYEVESETYTENQDSFIGNVLSKTALDVTEIPNNDSGTQMDDSETHNVDKTAEIILDGSTDDSGFENDNTYAHSMIKIFLHELSTTFQAIHSFVTNFIEEIKETELSKRRKDILHTQASKTLEDMVIIIQQLNCIIKRESAEDTVLKRLLLNAGVEATADKRATRYRQIVIKCLEQSLILESALKIIVSYTIGDFEAISTNADTFNSSLRYFNIFE